MGQIQEIHIRSLGELLDAATPRDPDPASGRLRDYAVYRGTADVQWSLLTSLDRLGGTRPPHTKAALEEHILRNFLRYSRPYLHHQVDNPWEALIIAQHHGLPTRLLDWSYSPLVAAHFATLENNPGANRVIWKLNWPRVHRHFGLRPVAFLVEDLGEMLKKHGIDSIWELFNLDESERKETFACMLEPPSLDGRLVAQSAVFTVCTSKTKTIDDFLLENGLGSALTKFVIPASQVARIRDQLDLCSVDERRLFPDLDGVAAELRRYYSSSPADDQDDS